MGKFDEVYKKHNEVQSEKTEKECDMVNHPAHYTSHKIEVIDFLESWELDFELANAVKYICRHKLKGNPIQDIEKAIWYLNRYYDKIDNSNSSTLTECLLNYANSTMVSSLSKEDYMRCYHSIKKPISVNDFFADWEDFNEDFIKCIKFICDSTETSSPQLCINQAIDILNYHIAEEQPLKSE